MYWVKFVEGDKDVPDSAFHDNGYSTRTDKPDGGWSKGGVFMKVEDHNLEATRNTANLTWLSESSYMIYNKAGEDLDKKLTSLGASGKKFNPYTEGGSKTKLRASFYFDDGWKLEKMQKSYDGLGDPTFSITNDEKMKKFLNFVITTAQGK